MTQDGLPILPSPVVRGSIRRVPRGTERERMLKGIVIVVIVIIVVAVDVRPFTVQRPEGVVDGLAGVRIYHAVADAFALIGIERLYAAETVAGVLFDLDGLAVAGRIGRLEVEDTFEIGVAHGIFAAQERFDPFVLVLVLLTVEI